MEQETAVALPETVEPADELTLTLSEPERGELIRALEQRLAQTPVTVPPDPRTDARNETLRGVLDRLRSFGA